MASELRTIALRGVTGCLIGALLVCGGCAVHGDMPRDRLGALPFPGHFSLYGTADAAHLGVHRYERWPRALGEDERERGIIYTARAGFIDLAHVRIAIDWTWHCTRLARAALEEEQTALAVAGPDHGVFHAALTYPAGWAEQSEAERARAIDEAAHRIGQRVTYLILTWHEVATWFGYCSFFFDESRSAFTYDDTVATLLGMRVAQCAMKEMSGETEREFDQAVTAALAVELGRLEPVTPAQTDQAVRAVEGVWWAGDQSLKRQTEVCPGEVEMVEPWLVRHLSFVAKDVRAEPFSLPCDRNDENLVIARLEIEPRISEAAAMRALLPGRPERFSEERDLIALLNAMRGQMRERYGADFGRPWPEGAVAHLRTSGF